MVDVLHIIGAGRVLCTPPLRAKEESEQRRLSPYIDSKISTNPVHPTDDISRPCMYDNKLNISVGILFSTCGVEHLHKQSGELTTCRSTTH